MQKNKPLLHSIKKVWNFIYDFFDRADRHHIYMMSAGISFNIILYILPSILVAIYIISFFADFEVLVSYLDVAIRQYLPPSEDSELLIKTLANELNLLATNVSLFGIISIISLLWLSSSLISAFRSALNIIFEFSSQRFFIWNRLKDIVLILILTLLVVLYVYAVPLVSFLIDIFQQHITNEYDWIINQAVFTIVNALLGFALFYVIFTYVPFKKIPLKARWIASFSSLILIEVSRNAFGWYIANVSDYGKFYGTYAVIISVIIWIYYSSLIILFSAELGKMLTDRMKSDEQ